MSPIWGVDVSEQTMTDMRQVAIDAIYQKHCTRINDICEWGEEDGEFAMHYGPAHIVWADGNYNSAQWCLDHWAEYDGDLIPNEHLEIVRQSLQELIAFLAKNPGDKK